MPAARGFYLRGNRAAAPAPDADPCDPAPLSLEATRQWLEHVRADAWYASQMPIGMQALGEAIGRPTALKTRGPANPWYAGLLDAVARVIPDIEARLLIFPVIGRGKPRGDERRPPRFLWTVAPAAQLYIRRLSPLSGWTLHAKCASCGGNRFLPVGMGNGSCVACYQCLPPNQYYALGATPMNVSLIMRAARRYY